MLVIVLSLFIMGMGDAQEVEEPIAPNTPVFATIENLIVKHNELVETRDAVDPSDLSKLMELNRQISYFRGAIDRERELVARLSWAINPYPPKQQEKTDGNKETTGEEKGTSKGGQ